MANRLASHESQIKATNGYIRKAGVEVQGGTDKRGYKLPDENLGENIILLKSQKYGIDK